jgi:hypothetical protein
VEKCGTARLATGDIIGHVCIADCITEATDKHSEHVILTAFPRTHLNVTFICTLPAFCA